VVSQPAGEMPLYLQAEHAAAIIKRGQHWPLTDLELSLARRYLTNALAGLPAEASSNERNPRVDP
jgi:hypothetical protein